MVTLKQRQELRKQLSKSGDGFVVSVDNQGDFKVLLTKAGTLKNEHIPTSFLDIPVAIGTYLNARYQTNPNSQPQFQF